MVSTRRQKKETPLEDDRTEFAAPDLIDEILKMLTEACRADHYENRLDTNISASLCLLVDMGTRIIDRGWTDWESGVRLEYYPSILITLGKAFGNRAAAWVKIGEKLREAAAQFKARVAKAKKAKAAKRKKSRAAKR